MNKNIQSEIKDVVINNLLDKLYKANQQNEMLQKQISIYKYKLDKALKTIANTKKNQPQNNINNNIHNKLKSNSKYTSKTIYNKTNTSNVKSTSNMLKKIITSNPKNQHSASNNKYRNKIRVNKSNNALSNSIISNSKSILYQPDLIIVNQKLPYLKRSSSHIKFKNYIHQKNKLLSGNI